MGKARIGALAGLLAALGLLVGVASPGLSQRPGPKPTFKGAVAARSKLTEEEVDQVLKVLGPAVRDQLAQGENVELPGLGTFRVVRIPEHRDLVQGRPATVPATNYVEFLPLPEVVQAANTSDVTPAVTVPAYEFDALKNQFRGERAPYVRQPNVRTR